MAIFDRITINPKIMAGKACIRDTRITVALILNLLANDASINEILDDYPELTKEDITACFKYAEWATSEQTLTSVVQ
ncbi:MAG: DUF433 domain-containing protein [Candidatus Heimdallarchaeota archaeon]|nr:DUF433 domain-containing protein [Candidatus Heimdallarchaeota archaeon]